jgi:decaprenyl-phosphate phosphoribosyltransferase
MVHHIWLLLSRGTRKRAWAKNLLVFVPLMVDPTLLSFWPRFLLLFICFSAVASAVYIFNDFIDVERDRIHPQKQNRVQVRINFSKVEVTAAASLQLLVFSLLLAPLFSQELFLCFSLYLGLNLFYSLRLKHIQWLDVGCLTLFLTIRIACGFALVSQWPSWPAIFCVCVVLFVSALAKRFLEVQYFLSRGIDLVLLGRPYGPSTLVHKAAAFSTVSEVTKE